LLQDIDCLEGFAEEGDILAGYYSKWFNADDVRLASLRERLAQADIQWSERLEYVYTDAELRLFPLLELSVDRKPMDVGGPQYGTAYDLSKACPRCGACAVQTSPLLLPLSGLPKKGLLCATVFHEILVGQRLKEALQEAGVTGLELRQVCFYRNDEPLPWWQMISMFEMPKMSADTHGISWHDSERGDCPVCERDGHGHMIDEPWDIAYSRVDVDVLNIPEVVRTWEVFGNSRVDKDDERRSWYGEQRILVKPKVFDIFRRLKIKHARFMPVRIVD